MSGQQVALLLQECLQCAISGPREAERPISSGLFPDELRALLQEAADRKWPFVEEKWQYKTSVTPEDKINSSDLIREHLPQLLVFLRDCIEADEPQWAVAVVFLVDRVLYWMDSSCTLLRVAKALHKRYPRVPIAPQLIIRQARVYLNSGKLQKAEFILSSLINKDAMTGSWTYLKVSDQTLVQAVSLQVRGQVLHKLGLWTDASELIWASLVGFFALPHPDKKGIGTSLGLLAQVLISMNDDDFHALQTKPHIDFSVLGEHQHQRLLSAAGAAQMAVVFSQYGSLYVLTNVVAQGTCLLSYSFSDKCSSEDRNLYLTLAKDAFEIGLLTNASEKPVTSKLELHTLLKAAYCLTLTHRWISGPSDVITTAVTLCHEATALLFQYSSGADASVCGDITAKIRRIRTLLKVQALRNSDPRSFVPDSYRSVEFGPAAFTLADFTAFLCRFRKHHRSVCDTFETRAGRVREDSSHCVTAFQIDTEATTQVERYDEHPLGALEGSDPKSLRSARQDSSSSGSSFVLVDSSGRAEISDELNCAGPLTQHTHHVQRATQDPCTTEDERGTHNRGNVKGNNVDKGLRLRACGSSGSSLDSSYEHVAVQPQSSIETEEDVLDPSHCDITSLSLTNRDRKTGSTSSFSLGSSFGSRSSWEKLSASSFSKIKVQERLIETDVALTRTETDPFEELGFEHLPDRHQEKVQTKAGSFETIPESCHRCFQECMMGSEVLTERDYRCLLAGVCHACLVERLPDKAQKSLTGRRQKRAYEAVVLRYSRASDRWMGSQSSVYIGERTGDCGTQRRAVEVLHLHQEQLLSRYVGKEYLQEKGLHAHLHDVERQMSAQHYVTEFNKRLYDNNVTAQIFFIPSEVLLILDGGRIETCLSAEPYMSGDFSKLTNNTKRTKTEHAATKYGVAFGHFTYEFSNHEEVVVDLQGWVTSNGKGLTYLTDPQIHSLRKHKSNNFQQTGIDNFLKYQHGDDCNEICRAAGLNTINTKSHK